MNRRLLRSAAGGAILFLALALASCNTPAEQVEYRPRPATRMVLLTPVPTSPLVMTVPSRVTVAPQSTPGPSAQAPTPPSATGIATSAVEIGGITPVPLLENTPAPGAVLTVVLPSGTAEGVGPFLTATFVAGSGVTPEPSGTPSAGGPSGRGTGTAAQTGTPAATTEPSATGAATGEPNSAPQAAASPPAATAEPPSTVTTEPPSTVTATQLTSPPAAPRTAGEQQWLDLGQQVYVANCATCHGNGGEGNAQFPALDGNTTVTGDPQLVIQTVLSGKGIMPSWRGKLSDEEIAAVVSYIRSAWSNDAGLVTVEMVTNRNR